MRSSVMHLFYSLAHRFSHQLCVLRSVNCSPITLFTRSRSPHVMEKQKIRRDLSAGGIRSSALNAAEQVVDRRFQRKRVSHLLPIAVVRSAKVASNEAALKALARELTSVKEKERQKIAEQLHDEFGQDLVLAKMKLGQLLAELPPQYLDGVTEVVNIIGGLIRHTRTLINQLYSEHLCEMGLIGALQSLTKEIQSRHGLICDVKFDEAPKALKDEVRQVLFRAVRELLFNVVKHARASRAKIVVTGKIDSVVIEVSDNGQGFDCNKTDLSELSVGRFGLFSVRAGLAPLGGDLRILSRVGSGTRATIALPIDASS